MYSYSNKEIAKQRKPEKQHDFVMQSVVSWGTLLLYVRKHIGMVGMTLTFLPPLCQSRLSAAHLHQLHTAQRSHQPDISLRPCGCKLAAAPKAWDLASLLQVTPCNPDRIPWTGHLSTAANQSHPRTWTTTSKSPVHRCTGMCWWLQTIEKCKGPGLMPWEKDSDHSQFTFFSPAIFLRLSLVI